MPNPAHVNISAAGVAKSAKNKEAIRLIEFSISKGVLNWLVPPSNTLLGGTGLRLN